MGERAFLRVVACSSTVRVEGLDEGGRAQLSGGFLVGVVGECNLRVRGTHIGGQKNCRFDYDARGSWRIQHMGHHRPIHVAGERMDNNRVLVHGDIIEFETDPGLELRFVFEVE